MDYQAIFLWRILVHSDWEIGSFTSVSMPRLSPNGQWKPFVSQVRSGQWEAGKTGCIRVTRRLYLSRFLRTPYPCCALCVCGDCGGMAWSFAWPDCCRWYRMFTPPLLLLNSTSRETTTGTNEFKEVHLPGSLCTPHRKRWVLSLKGCNDLFHCAFPFTGQFSYLIIVKLTNKHF